MVSKPMETAALLYDASVFFSPFIYNSAHAKFSNSLTDKNSYEAYTAVSTE